jgi:hypothetical protein
MFQSNIQKKVIVVKIWTEALKCILLVAAQPDQISLFVTLSLMFHVFWQVTENSALNMSVFIYSLLWEEITCITILNYLPSAIFMALPVGYLSIKGAHSFIYSFIHSLFIKTWHWIPND